MQERLRFVIRGVVSSGAGTPFAGIRAEVLRRLPADERQETLEYVEELDQLIFEELYPLKDWEWPLFQRATEMATGHSVRVDSSDSDNHEVFVCEPGDPRPARVLFAAVRLIPQTLFDDQDAFGVFLKEFQMRIDEYFVTDKLM